MNPVRSKKLKIFADLLASRTSNGMKGFTLIEVLVSTMIFTVVMVIALGALLSMSDSDRKAETLKSVINNLNFSLDSMSRAIRTGSNYHCDTAGTLASPRDCASGASYFAFLANDGVTNVAYCLDGTTVKREATVGALSTDCSSAVFLPLTAPEVQITSLRFFVTGSLAGAADPTLSQPKVTMLLRGNVPVSGISARSSQFNLGTSITQRLYDQ